MRTQARWLAAAAFTAGFAAGCLSPSSVTCGDGRVCPAGTTCGTAAQGCITSGQSAACQGVTEGAPCMLTGGAGKCVAGICQLFVCGDGLRNGGEECDGRDLGGKSCVDLHFYGQITTDSGLACNSDCTFNAIACTGFCGDGVVNGPEECDGMPSKSCVDAGYDHGFAACSATCQNVFDGCASFGEWQAVTPEMFPVPANLPGALPRGDAVWGSSPKDVYVIANGGTVTHWDGNTWSATSRQLVDPLAAPNSVSLAAIWGSGPSDVFLVGTLLNGPAAWHWDGNQWSTLPSPPGIVNAIWGSGSSDVYAVGGSVYHWDGTQWSTRNISIGPYFTVWGTGPQDVYVSGGGAPPVMPTPDGGILPPTTFHWDGSAWSTVPEVQPLGGNTPRPVPHFWGSDPGDVFAVGVAGQIMHWNGSVWSSMSSGVSANLTGVWGNSADDVFAVGSDSNGNGTIVHWDGVTWMATSEPRTDLTGVWVGQGAGFAVGNAILTHTGAHWGSLPFPDVRPSLNGVWGTDDGQLFAVGQAGTLAHWDGSSWSTTALDATVPMNAVHGSGPDDVYAVGQSTESAAAAMTHAPQSIAAMIAHWDGSSWSHVANAPSAPYAVDLSSVWSNNPNDVYAVGSVLAGAPAESPGYAFHWNGTEWSSIQGLGNGLDSVWASGADDVYIGGQYAGGQDMPLNHWNGTAWTTLPVFPPNTGVTAIWGSSAQNVFVSVGNSLNQWDGSGWKLPEQLPLKVIAGSGPGDVFGAAGNVLLHLRANGWERIALPVTGSIAGMWVTPTRVTLVGSMGELHLDRPSVTCVNPERDCTDGWDNDCDGLADTDDPDCAGMFSEVCANGADDDGDGLVDCADPDCAEFPNCRNNPPGAAARRHR